MAYRAHYPIIYKIGTIGIIMTFVVFVVGFGTPVWYRSSVPIVGVREYGLWQICEENFKNCKYLEWYEVVVVRGIEIAALAFHLSATIAVFIGFCSSTSNPMMIPIMGILAGVFGITGDILFSTWGIDKQNPTNNSSNHLSWSFVLAVIGSGFVTLFSVLVAVAMCYFRRPEKAESDISDVDARESERRQSAPKYPYQNQNSLYQPSHHSPYAGDKMPMQDIPRHQSGYRSSHKPSYDPDQYQYYGGNQRKMYQSSQRYGYDQRY